MHRTRIRFAQDLWEQGLLPNGKYGYANKWTRGRAKDRRSTAVENVLTTLPEPYFSRFKEKMENGAWFTPWHGLWGKAAEIPPRAVIIFLSPLLELADDWVVDSVVVHEILHVALAHELSNCTDEENARQEKEVREKAAHLGYADPRAELTKLFESFPKPPG
jgi:hypothetical protein